HQYLRRPRNLAGARARNQTAKAARGVDRERGESAVVQGTSQIRRQRTAALSVIRAQSQAVQPREAFPVSGRDGTASAQGAHRTAALHRGGGRTGRAAGARDTGDSAL